MTESNKSGSNDPKEKMSEKELLKEEKKKVKVLKQALKEGRNKQDTTEAELKNALGKMDMLQNQMQEKVSTFGLTNLVGETLFRFVPRENTAGGDYYSRGSQGKNHGLITSQTGSYCNPKNKQHAWASSLVFQSSGSGTYGIPSKRRGYRIRI